MVSNTTIMVIFIKDNLNMEKNVEQVYFNGKKNLYILEILIIMDLNMDQVYLNNINFPNNLIINENLKMIKKKGMELFVKIKRINIFAFLKKISK